MNIKWNDRIEMWLRGEYAPRVFTRAELYQAVNDREKVCKSTFSRWLHHCLRTSKLNQVTPRLYLNGLARLPVAKEEAVDCLFPSAVVSLQRVLKAHGIMKGGTTAITAVWAKEAMESPFQAGRHVYAMGEVFVTPMPRAILTAGGLADRLDLSLCYPAATPEKALVDWLYLASDKGSRMKMPPLETMALDRLDLDKVRRLALAAGLVDMDNPWVQEVMADHMPDYEALPSPTWRKSLALDAHS